ncbi:Iron-containing redox enzyme [Nannocystis exedens]|uniref:Iron-containing redox enzyme n=1 Tax=Nannocystis exedens TaxID=54 RepID=A0A1I2I0Y6_9BACT|nr:iron-containing redox enzyme family protein [Nannocystis exedens]PCC68481.1 hypothetical protein NAEX_01496 [Nannocystis exedens]SFF36065.1 Iron-containing redox enzyme [Nannocystis exedens]
MIDRIAVTNYVAASLERIRRHPFIQEAHAQRLTRAQVERWIMCAGRESRSFPDILMNMLEWSTDPRLRETLTENLNDELGNGDPSDAHFHHYLQLIDALALDPADFYAYPEASGISLAVALAYNMSKQGDEAAALGYMLVNEAMTPITYGAVKVALLRYYPGLATDFFDLHVTVDARHVEGLYGAVEALPEDTLGRLLYGIDMGERGMASLLDEAYGSFDHCRAVPSLRDAPPLPITLQV